MKKALIASLILLLFAASDSLGEVWGAYTLEWLADHCHDSGIYSVKGTEEEKREHSKGYNITLKLSRKFRGEPPPEVLHGYYAIKWVKTSLPSVREGDEFLVCIQRDETGSACPIQLINLTNPGLYFPSIVAISCDLRLLRNREDILKVFEDRLSSHPDTTPEIYGERLRGMSIEVDYGAEIHKAIWGGSDCYVEVPDDCIQAVTKKMNELAAANQQALSSKDTRQEDAQTSDDGQQRSIFPYIIVPLVLIGVVFLIFVLAFRKKMNNEQIREDGSSNQKDL
jgi:hypothetical protein